jgi:DNA-binding CsgD family transcriptional regulator
VTYHLRDGAARRVDELIEHAYEAVLEPSRWSHVLRGLAALVDGERPLLFGHDLQQRAGAISVALDYDNRSVRDYGEYYARRNLWLEGAGGRGLLKNGVVRVSHEMCSHAELIRSEYYNGFLKPLGIAQGLGATIWRDRTASYNLTVMGGKGRRPFGAREVRLVQHLMPHLQRAMRMHRYVSHLALQERAQAEALDRMPAGLILVDVRHRVVFSNRAARAIVDAADGLRVNDGRLRTDRPVETKQLHELVAGAAAARATGSPAGGGVMTVSRRSLGPPLSVLVTSLAIGQDFLIADPPVAAVFVFNHDAPGESAESILVRLHGLSRAEARVVGRLLTGDTVERAADRLTISIHTARTHLKRALAKTGTNRQTDLLRRVLTGPAGLRAQGES